MYARIETSPQDAIGNFGMKLATFLTWCAMNNKVPIIDDAFQKYGRNVALQPTVDMMECDAVKGESSINAFFHFNPFNVEHLKHAIKPTKELQQRIDSFYPLIKECKAAFHVRRGTCAEDSAKYGFLPFASQKAVDTMIEEARKIKGKVFVASDSLSTKKYIREQLGEDKVVTMDFEIGFTADEHSQYVDVKDEAIENKLNSYVEWFLLGKCPTVYITAGGVCGRNVPHGTQEGITSTFGYSAAVYGGKVPYYVFNDGGIFYPFVVQQPTDPRYCWSDLPIPQKYQQRE